MKSIQGARVNSQTQGVAGPKHSSVLAKGFPSEREICRNLRHNSGYTPRILYTVSELFIHTLTRFPTLPPSGGDKPKNILARLRSFSWLSRVPICLWSQ